MTTNCASFQALLVFCRQCLEVAGTVLAINREGLGTDEAMQS